MGLVVHTEPGERVYPLLQRRLNIAAERWGEAAITINKAVAVRVRKRG